MTLRCVRSQNVDVGQIYFYSFVNYKESPFNTFAGPLVLKRSFYLSSVKTRFHLSAPELCKCELGFTIVKKADGTPIRSLTITTHLLVSGARDVQFVYRLCAHLALAHLSAHTHTHIHADCQHVQGIIHGIVTLITLIENHHNELCTEEIALGVDVP